MNVGIITILDNDNYGNRLQNYALYYTLKKIGLNVKTILNEPFSNTKEKYFLRCIKNLNYKGTYSLNQKRKDNFYEFNKLIEFTSEKITPYKNKEEFDFYIVGSDQVWNPNFGRLRDVDLLTFSKKNNKISFAASFGVNKLEPKFFKNIKELKKFKAISVREYEGKKIIEDIVGRNDVEVVVDPTMLLTASEWDKVSKKPKMLKSTKFILNYFLGDLSDERKKEIDRIALENDCQVINILDKKSPFYSCGPSEFLYLEKNAFLICTDSFHSCVFAILYNRPFIIFEREQKEIVSMNSRIDTLLRKFNLLEIKEKNISNYENVTLDYKTLNSLIEDERKKAKKFLEKALEIKGGE